MTVGATPYDIFRWSPSVPDVSFADAQDAVVEALAHVYRRDDSGVFLVAQVCYHDLDPSGRLLGLVRSRANEIAASQRRA